MESVVYASDHHMTLVARVRQAVRLDPPWWEELCAYYGTHRARAERLGQRAQGRRPDFGAWGGPNGLTYEEVWHLAPRETPEQIAAFYRALGPWPVFRQVYRRRFGAWPQVSRDLPPSGTLLEYGCGIAPVTAWLERRRTDFRAVLVDVPGQAFSFATWRLARRRNALDGPTLDFLALNALVQPLARAVVRYDVAVVSEVLEHVPHPVAVMDEILAGLKSGGVLYEDFTTHDFGSSSPADLESAASERTEMYGRVRDVCELIDGSPPEAPGGGGVRRWCKRYKCGLDDRAMTRAEAFTLAFRRLLPRALPCDTDARIAAFCRLCAALPVEHYRQIAR